MEQQIKENDKCFFWSWKSFRIIFFCEKNLIRDLLILGILIFVLGVFLINNWRLQKKNEEENFAKRQAAQENILPEQEALAWQKKEIANIQSGTDISAWATYQNLWYGFSLRYPKEWLDPVIQKAPAGAMWEQKVQFRSNQESEINPFEGFDVVIYAVSRVKELSKTDEFPKLKNAELLANDNGCVSITGHLLETGNYPAEEIYIPINDPCYGAVLFFTNTRDNYIYIIAPKIKDGAGLAGEPAREIVQHLPEFFPIISEWSLIDIQRPKTALLKPKISAPRPVAYSMVSGRMVCDKGDKDRPGKSKKGKGRHLDMECCFDPDEYPNPWCYYSPDKYGKYL